MTNKNQGGIVRHLCGCWHTKGTGGGKACGTLDCLCKCSNKKTIKTKKIESLTEVNGYIGFDSDTTFKLDYSLAPPEFDDVILVLQHSAESGKYGRNDWLEGKDYDTESSIASMKRHIREYREGVRKDKDNGLHPMLMVACRSLMQYTLDKRKNDPYPEGYDAENAEKSWSTGCVNTRTDEKYCNQCKYFKDSQAHKQICEEGH